MEENENLSAECTHDCSSCGLNCGSRSEDGDTEAGFESANTFSDVKKVIAVVSGKGGVGKSLVTSLVSAELNRRGHSVAIMDADITGPSVPSMFGSIERASGTELGLLPVETKTGIKIMSMNLLLDSPEDPVVWRGPIIGGVVTQFWKDVVWGDIDYMLIDMPPGTGDVPLTVFQSVPVDGIIIVTSPQELVSTIVEKALRMAELMKVPVLAIVENMSYFECPDCGKRHAIFGDSHIERTAEKHGIKLAVRLPIDPEYAKRCDSGEVENINSDAIKPVADMLEGL